MATQTTVQPKSTPAVIDVNEQTFQTEVLDRSRSVPVVVDFWAPWCGPCRTLGPILERLANEAGGAFVLAKVNADLNQRLAMTFRVQGIPAVKAFRDGQVIDEFTGALPESQVRAWLQRFAPGTTDRLAQEAAALESIDPQAAAARYRIALEHDSAHAASMFGLGRLLIAQGDPNGAELLRTVPAGASFYARAQALLHIAPFFQEVAQVDQAALKAQVVNEPGNMEARYQMAAILARTGHYADAMEHLLGIVQRDRAFRNDGARQVLLALFEMIGDDNPLANEYRRKLANALF
ncbi:MAG: tetratricopeptide repeat protein [Chloroflexales bacterium]|nr:tetratricopeptide repeat protein [Chloroflexales bacterium]